MQWFCFEEGKLIWRRSRQINCDWGASRTCVCKCGWRRGKGEGEGVVSVSFHNDF